MQALIPASRHSVRSWLYHHFTLSLRDVEGMFAHRGIDGSGAGRWRDCHRLVEGPAKPLTVELTALAHSNVRRELLATWWPRG